MLASDHCVKLLSGNEHLILTVAHNACSSHLKRLKSVVTRRVWAERAAAPVYSRYLQSLIGLMVCCERGGLAMDNSAGDSTIFEQLPEAGVDEWQAWRGSLSVASIDDALFNKKGKKSGQIRSLNDSGEGSPFLNVGDAVVRGPDYDESDEEDGRAPLREKKAKSAREVESVMKGLVDNLAGEEKEEEKSINTIAVGTVTAVTSFEGVPGAGRRVKWSKTGIEKTYRWNFGGKYDIASVSVNEEETVVHRRYMFPESGESIAARGGFGAESEWGIVLRVGHECALLEMPHFGAGVLCSVEKDSEGLTLKEQSLVWGDANNGWIERFGVPHYIPNTVIKLSKNKGFGSERMEGVSTFSPKELRSSEGKTVVVASDWRVDLLAGETSMLEFDPAYTANTLALSKDRLSVWCTSSEVRGMAWSTVGYCTGRHYWECKIEGGEPGSVCVGVAARPLQRESMNRWNGHTFVNFRATASGGAERIYGQHFNAGDVIGVLLDCDAGRLSFFLDGLKFGEHILRDLGVAFEGVSPQGYVDSGLGVGGLGQGAPFVGDGGRRGGNGGGKVMLSALFPVVGLKNVGDRVTFTRKHCSSLGEGRHPVRLVNDLLSSSRLVTGVTPPEFAEESKKIFEKWREGGSVVVRTRGDMSLKLSTKVSRRRSACRAHPFLTNTPSLSLLRSQVRDMVDACVRLGVSELLLAGDRIKLKRSNGRPLELEEIAEITGVHDNMLYYTLISQKGEGGSLSEGGGRAWCMNQCDTMAGSFEMYKRKHEWSMDYVLELSKEFAGGMMKVVYDAVVRSDLELDGVSDQIGSIPKGDASVKFLERRRNSCNVVRLKVEIGEGETGWISERIRGGEEELIGEVIVEGGVEGRTVEGIVNGVMRRLKNDGFAGEAGGEMGIEVRELEWAKLVGVSVVDDLNEALVAAINEWHKGRGGEICEVDGRSVDFCDAVCAFR